MAASDITIGENYISEVDLVDSDGNTVLLSALENYSVKIMQYNRVIETIAEASPKLTAGTTTSKLKIETSEETSLKFREGKVYARVVTGDTNALYTEDGERISMPDYHILTAYIQRPEDEDTVTTVIEHYRGLYDASVNAAPSSGGAGTGGAILGGDYWISNVAGTVFGTPYPVNTRFQATVNNPGQTQSNWHITSSQG